MGSLDETSWVEGNPSFLFPVGVIGALFRGKFLDGLHRLRNKGELRLPENLVDDKAWKAFRRRLYDKSWVVYAKRPLAGADHIYRYLGRYTHRVAISSARLRSVSGSEVVFHTRNDQVVSLPPEEFIRRYLLHVLPSGFRKIRHYGLYGPGAVPKRRLEAAHRLAPRPKGEASAPRTPWQDLLANLIATLRTCPHCGVGRLHRVNELREVIPAHPDDDPRWRPPILDSS